MHFDRRFAGFPLAFGDDYITVNPEAQALGKAKLVPDGVGQSVLGENFVHHENVQSQRALR